MFNALPVLETQRLSLTGARHDDLKTLQEHWDDPLVRRYLFDDQPVDEALAKVVLDACLDGVQQGHGLWLLTERGSQDFVGSAALIPTSVAAEYEPLLKGLLEPMISLAPIRWGNGLATEALSAVLGHAFKTLTVASVAAVNHLPNAASERMLLRAGFTALSEVAGPKYRLRTFIIQRHAWLARHDA
ncbi:MAG: GNAT family N-acetyltransferase [Nitrospira sp.]|nr:GNAT family N-acetyltransferase [Nitrospira sp.]